MGSKVKFTCPDINKIIDIVLSAIESAENGKESNELEYVYDCFNDIINGLSNIENMMEDLRSDNSELRDYGSEQAYIVDEKEKEIDILTEEKQSLYYQLNESEIRIKELENEIYNLKKELDESNIF